MEARAGADHLAIGSRTSMIAGEVMMNKQMKMKYSLTLMMFGIPVRY